MKNRILVIDDDFNLLSLISIFLAKKGYEVTAVDNGKDGLSKVKELRPHIVVLDINLPDINGVEVLRKIKEIDPRVVVIMSTAVHEEEIGKKCLDLGATDYITKPFNLGVLESIILLNIFISTT